jgi:four helix bundle protein
MKNYDLETRTLEFSKKIIYLCKKLPHDRINNRLVDQLIRSGTSIGANYREANETDTKKDFRNKIRIAKKEAKETIYWLELIIEANSNFKEEILLLLEESYQLMKILAAIYAKLV